MARSYSQDLRERVIHYVDRGGDREAACEIFQIGIATLQRWLSQFRREGHIDPKPLGSRPWKLNHDAVVEYVNINNDATLQEVADHFGTVVSSIDYILRRRQITRKKNHAVCGEKRAKKTSISG
jgi:transposase